MDCGTTDIGKGKRKIDYTMSHCPHGKKQSSCVPCGGNGICEHKTNKHTCAKCNKGKGKRDWTKSHCPHGKQKSFCIPCGGNGICVHQTQKYTCKECKGSSLCEHNVQKYDCRGGCGGGRCDHGKQKSIAKAVMVESCAKPHTVLPEKTLSMMDTVSFAMSISFRIRLLHGTI